MTDPISKAETIEQLERLKENLEFRIQLDDIDGVDDLATLKEHNELTQELNELRSSRAPNISADFTLAHTDTMCSSNFKTLNEILPETPINIKSPPHYAAMFIRWVKTPERTEEILGDLSEDFQYDVKKFSEGYARCLYWKQCLRILFEELRAWIVNQLPFSR